MRYLWAISLAIVCQSVLAVDIFGTDYFLRDSFVRVIDDERGTSIVLDTDIFFDEPGSNDLDAEQYETLEKVARLVNQHSDAYLSITGHTDDVYSQQVRYEISDAQARRIADFLVDYGVDPNRIREVTGEGDLWPIADNDTQERRHINRRVEITFLRKPPAKVVRHEGTRYEKREVIEVEVERKRGETEIEVEVVESEHEAKALKQAQPHKKVYYKKKAEPKTSTNKHKPVVKKSTSSQHPSVIVNENAPKRDQ